MKPAPNRHTYVALGSSGKLLLSLSLAEVRQQPQELCHFPLPQAWHHLPPTVDLISSTLSENHDYIDISSDSSVEWTAEGLTDVDNLDVASVDDCMELSD
jgi:hypothetical protein